MTVTINGSGSITEEITIDGVKVGQGGGNVATNTAVGVDALAANEAGGTNNTAVGYQALDANTTGDNNVAMGRGALTSNTTASNNTAIGDSALATNTTGTANVAVGTDALIFNTTGSNNTALGTSALVQNTTASGNTAMGFGAGIAITTGADNTIIGREAGEALTTSGSCVFIGSYSGEQTTGANNTFVGKDSGYLVTTGAKNTILGRYNGNGGGLDIRTASNRIVLSDGDGFPRMHFLSDGEPVIPRLTSSTTGSAANVFVSSTTGELVRSTSSLKYKRDVQDATHGLAEVMQLRPVTYKGKSQVDGETVFGGLVAEEVHDAGLTEFVQYAADGTPDALAYGNMVSLCVKAIQELSAQVTALQAEVNALKGQ
jgi:trimeric autotransporter adhesin